MTPVSKHIFLTDGGGVFHISSDASMEGLKLRAKRGQSSGYLFSRSSEDGEYRHSSTLGAPRKNIDEVLRAYLENEQRNDQRHNFAAAHRRGNVIAQSTQGSP